MFGVVVTSDQLITLYSLGLYCTTLNAAAILCGVVIRYYYLLSLVI